MAQIAKMDPGNDYLAPWLWGITTVGINRGKVRAALGSMPMPDDAWDLFFKPEYLSKLKGCGVSVLDSGDEIFPAALRYLHKPPYSQDPADYQEAAKLLATIQPYITVFSSSGYINDLAAGALCLSIGYSGDIGIAAQRAKEANNGQDIQVLVPKSGALLFFDTMAIPADAEHVAAAYQWINFIYRPEVQVGIVNKVRYPNLVRASDPLVDPELRANRSLFLTEEDLARMPAVEPVGNRIRRMRTRLFTRFKTGL
jgi:putrescine transport system substrate-binding protein